MSKLNNEWNLYRKMYTIRRMEETLLDLYSTGLFAGTVHTCIGQEACAVGVVEALDRARDIVWSNHRSHGHFIAYCDDVEGLVAEIMGKESGVCRGIGGSQHLHKNNFYSSGILGGTIPPALGTAFAEKHKGTNAISCVFFGDGALGEGVVYECLNIASLWQLPVLFVLEHNQYAQSTPTQMEQAGELSRRAEPFGIEWMQMVASDVREVNSTAHKLVAKVREQSRPFFLALQTYRFAPHSKGDDFRSLGEIEENRRRDPLLLLRQELANTDQGKLSLLEEEVEKRLKNSVENAEAANVMTFEQYVQEVVDW